MKLKLFHLKKVFLLMAVFASPAYGSRLNAVIWEEARRLGICEDYLSEPYYSVNGAFQQRIKPTLTPEPGSIESRHPGIISELIEIRKKLIDLDRIFQKSYLGFGGPSPFTPGYRDGVIFSLQELKALLERYQEDLQVAEFAAHLISNWQSYKNLLESGDHIKAYAANERMQKIISAFWEFIVACTFYGEEIHVNKTVSQFLPKEFAALKVPRKERPKIDREVDIAIRKKDGSWRWIEVKDWSPKRMKDGWSIDQLNRQSLGQFEVREMLPDLSIQLEAVLKYGVPIPDYLSLRVGSYFDKI